MSDDTHLSPTTVSLDEAGGRALVEAWRAVNAAPKSVHVAEQSHNTWTRSGPNGPHGLSRVGVELGRRLGEVAPGIGKAIAVAEDTESGMLNLCNDGLASKIPTPYRRYL